MTLQPLEKPGGVGKRKRTTRASARGPIPFPYARQKLSHTPDWFDSCKDKRRDRCLPEAVFAGHPRRCLPTRCTLPTARRHDTASEQLSSTRARSTTSVSSFPEGSVRKSLCWSSCCATIHKDHQITSGYRSEDKNCHHTEFFCFAAYCSCFTL